MFLCHVQTRLAAAENCDVRCLHDIGSHVSLYACDELSPLLLIKEDGSFRGRATIVALALRLVLRRLSLREGSHCYPALAGRALQHVTAYPHHATLDGDLNLLATA